jgi:hypothetical protein
MIGNMLVGRDVKLEFLGAFAEVGKVTISFVVSVCMEELGWQWTDFY